MDDLSEILSLIEKGELPPCILVGGDSDYLVSHAWDAIRDEISRTRPDVSFETWSEESDLARIAESYRTASLFGGERLLVVPEVHAFVTKKELSSLLSKAIRGWESARTDRKRKSSIAKLMHVLGLAGLHIEDTDDEIIDQLGVKKGKKALGEMLGSARETGASQSRGEEDSAILSEMIAEGGAAGAHLLLRAGALPADSATLSAIESNGGVVLRCDLDRKGFPAALEAAVREIADEWNVRVEKDALDTLKDRLGIARVLEDKWSKEVPDLSGPVAELERLAAYAGEGGSIDAAMIEQQIEVLDGGRRFEIGSLLTEGEIGGAIEKLRALVEQTRRENRRIPDEIAYGRFLFPVADEIRQLIAIASFCRLRNMQGMSYNAFRDRVVDELSSSLLENGIVSRKPHPFVLYKKFEAVTRRRFSERGLVECLRRLSQVELERKSGGVPVDVGLEAAILSLRAG